MLSSPYVLVALAFGAIIQLLILANFGVVAMLLTNITGVLVLLALGYFAPYEDENSKR